MAVVRFVGAINFNDTLMHGMLCFLLFAGTLHVDLRHLARNRWAIGILSTLGVVISTVLVGALTWLTFGALGLGTPLMACLAFGALISPTDPIAVIGLLKELGAPAALEAQIAGESLFNDGIGVVVFFGVLSLGGLSGGHAAGPADLLLFFVREVGGGAGLGLALGLLAYRALLTVDDHPLELLITLALAMFLYTLSLWVHVSGPIAVVVAGLLIGNAGRADAMSARTREHLDAFWDMTDSVLNAVLFLLLGLQVLTVPVGPQAVLAGGFAIPIVLMARLISVAIPVLAMRWSHSFVPGIVPILTWSGLRGGLSVAMVLSLPAIPGLNLLIVCTYAVVVFSILVQGLTTRRLLVHYGVGVSASAAHAAH